MINLRLGRCWCGGEDLGDAGMAAVRRCLGLTSGSCPRRYAAVLYGVAFKGAYELSLELEQVFPFGGIERRARATLGVDPFQGKVASVFRDALLITDVILTATHASSSRQSKRDPARATRGRQASRRRHRRSPEHARIAPSHRQYMRSMYAALEDMGVDTADDLYRDAFDPACSTVGAAQGQPAIQRGPAQKLPRGAASGAYGSRLRSCPPPAGTLARSSSAAASRMSPTVHCCA